MTAAHEAEVAAVRANLLGDLVERLRARVRRKAAQDLEEARSAYHAAAVARAKARGRFSADRGRLRAARSAYLERLREAG